MTFSGFQWSCLSAVDWKTERKLLAILMFRLTVLETDDEDIIEFSSENFLGVLLALEHLEK